MKPLRSFVEEHGKIKKIKNFHTDKIEKAIVAKKLFSNRIKLKCNLIVSSRRVSGGGGAGGSGRPHVLR